MITRRAGEAIALAMAISLFVGVVAAQDINVERFHAFVVGSGARGFREDRADAVRSGWTKTPLPRGALRTLWSTSVAATDASNSMRGVRPTIDQASVVDEHGTVYAVDTSMKVTSVASDGTVRWNLRPSAGGKGPSPLALLADGTLVVLDSSGQVFAIKQGSVRWTVALGFESRTTSTVALDDGGVGLCAGQVMALLDVDGNVRARTRVPAAIETPLVAYWGAILAADATGAVWSWKPGPGMPQRIGGFGEPTDSFAAVGRWLVAVARSGTRVLALDVSNGQTSVLATTTPGERFAGPPTLNPFAPEREISTIVFAATASSLSSVVVGFDGRVRERRLLQGFSPVTSTDGGIEPASAEARTPPLVDPSGTLVFATSGGDVGIVRGESVWRAIAVCGHYRTESDSAASHAGRALPLVIGLAPLRPGAVVVTCGSGAIVALGELEGGREAPPSSMAEELEGGREAPPSSMAEELEGGREAPPSSMAEHETGLTGGKGEEANL